MTFHDADLLWLLLLVPLASVLLVGAWRWRERATERFGTRSTLARLRLGESAGLRSFRGVLLVLGLGIVVVALAGPQYGSRTRVLRQRGIDIVVALDFSKSMLAQDVLPSRVERAKAELARFLQELEGDRVGIVAFAGETMEFPMTTDYSAMSLFLRDLRPEDMPVGGTAIGRALEASWRLLERSRGGSEEAATEEAPPRAQAVVLLTDGEDHEGDPVAVARELAQAGVKVYVIGVGSRTGEPIPTYSPDGTWTGYMRDEAGEVITTALTAENEEQLARIAEVTGGEYVRAREGSVGMEAVREHIRSLQQGERRSRRVTVHENRYALVLLPGFLLLLLEAFLPEARRRRRTASEGAA